MLLKSLLVDLSSWIRLGAHISGFVIDSSMAVTIASEESLESGLDGGRMHGSVPISAVRTLSMDTSVCTVFVFVVRSTFSRVSA